MELRSATLSGTKHDSLSPWTSPQKLSTPTKTQAKPTIKSPHRSARIAKLSRKPSPAHHRLRSLRRLRSYIPDSDDEDQAFQRPKHYGSIVRDSEDETFEESLDDTSPNSEADVVRTTRQTSHARKRSKCVPATAQHHHRRGRKREKNGDQGKLHPSYVRDTN